MESLYANTLRDLLTDPSSFRGTPGFKFALDSGSDAVARKAAAAGMNQSGNMLGELMRFGTGLASQEYGGMLDRLGRLVGQEQQYDLGQEGNRLAGVRDANAFTLGKDRLALDNKQADQTFGLGAARAANDFTLGQQSNANTAQRNWWDYSLGRDRNNIAESEGRNRNALDWYNARTSRGTAQSNDFWRGWK